MACPERYPSGLTPGPSRWLRATPARCVLLAVAALAASLTEVADAKLISGLAPCPNGAPPHRECLVSVLVDLRALRARARERSNATLPVGGYGSEQQTSQASLAPLAPPLKDTAQELVPPPPPHAVPDRGLGSELGPELRPRPPFPPPLPSRQAAGSTTADVKVRQQQERRQHQLEQAVRFQEDELQQLREQVQELRLQLARALQLYQMTAGAGLTGRQAPPPPPGIKPLKSAYYYQSTAPDPGFPGLQAQAVEAPVRRFYRTLPGPEPQALQAVPAAQAVATGYPVFGQRLNLGSAGLRQLAAGETVVAT